MDKLTENVYGIFDHMVGEYVTVFKSINDLTASRTVAGMRFGNEILDLSLYLLAVLDLRTGSVVPLDSPEHVAHIFDIAKQYSDRFNSANVEDNND